MTGVVIYHQRRFIAFHRDDSPNAGVLTGS